MKTISLIDTEAANLHSVYKAFKYIGTNIEITKDPNIIKNADCVVFPGVGAFGNVMGLIKKNNLKEPIITAAKSGKPFFGICLGLQVLFEESEEHPTVKGLGIFKGKVVKFKKVKKVPHVGWNDIQMRNAECGMQSGNFYFVHSYYVIPEDKSIICGTTEYDGEIFTSIIKKDNLLATQFHPEKSGEAGLSLLEEFMKTI